MIRLFASSLLFLALLPAVALAHEGTELTVQGDVRPNGPIVVEGEDFAPNDVVRIELRKDGVEPIELGRVAVEDEGGFSETLHVPENVPPGLYQLAAEGEESATFDLTILEPAEGTQPVVPDEPAENSAENDRPMGETLGLAIVTALVAVAAVTLLWFSRTRARAIDASRPVER